MRLFLRPVLALVLPLLLLAAACSSSSSSEGDQAQAGDAVATPSDAVAADSPGGDADDSTETPAEADDPSAATTDSSDAGADGESAAGAVDPEAGAAADPAPSGDSDSDNDGANGTGEARACPADGSGSTASVLGSLAEDLTEAGAPEIATRVEELAPQFAGSDGSPESLVTLMELLPDVGAALAGEGNSACLDALSGVLGRFSIGTDAAEETSPVDDLTTVLARGYDLSNDDAACVADNLTADGNDAPDDLAVLVALSVCENEA